MKIKNLLALLLVVWGSSACSVVIKDFENYTSTGAARAPLAPAPDKIKTGQTKVVLYNIEDKTTNDKKSAVSRIVSSNLRKLLSETNVSIIDRSALETFSEEAILTATEQNTDTEFSAAQYAIKGQIDSVDSYSNYTAEYFEDVVEEVVNSDGSVRTVNKKNFYPATCDYTGQIKGRLEFYSLPQLEQVLLVTLDGASSTTVNAESSGVGVLGALSDNSLLAVGAWAVASANLDEKCKNQNAQVSTLSKASEKSISKKERKKLLNQFAAKGYVSDVRKLKNKYIIQVTLGQKHGVRQNRKVHIFRQRKKLNALSGEETVESIKIAEGKSSQLLESDSAWLVVKDKDEAEKIFIGDIVKVIY